jgi:hypothetical protein
MTSARGDSKPCTHDGCAGRMHFRRTEGYDLRWECDNNAEHRSVGDVERDGEAAVSRAAPRSKGPD